MKKLSQSTLESENKDLDDPENVSFPIFKKIKS